MNETKPKKKWLSEEWKTMKTKDWNDEWMNERKNSWRKDLQKKETK